MIPNDCLWIAYHVELFTLYVISEQCFIIIIIIIMSFTANIDNENLMVVK